MLTGSLARTKIQKIRFMLANMNLWDSLALFTLIACIYIGACLYLAIPMPVGVYNDSREYIKVAQHSIFSYEFWNALRPVTVPLLLKIAQYHLSVYTWLQTALFCGAWLFFTYSAGMHIKKPSLRICAWIILPAFSLSKDLFFWNRTVLSESLSISLMVCMLALYLHRTGRLAGGRSETRLQTFIFNSIFAFVMILWSFSHDSNVYSILFTAGIIFVLQLIFKNRFKPVRVHIYVGILIIGLLFILQTHQAANGYRWQRPMMNILGLRIIDNKDHYRFFVENGLPDTAAVRKTGRKSFFQHQWPDIDQWLESSAKKTYILHLLKRPLYHTCYPFYMWIKHIDTKMFEFYGTFVNMPPPPAWQKIITAVTYPRKAFLFIVPAALMLLAIQLRRIIIGSSSCPFFRLLIIILLLGAPVRAFIGWHGDAIEVGRHLFGFTFHMRLVVLLIIIDYLNNYSWKKIRAEEALKAETSIEPEEQTTDKCQGAGGRGG